MADLSTKTVLSVIATKKDKLKDLAIKNGQLIFVQDSHKIAFDFGGIRKFYNQIVELENEEERISLSSPVNGLYYFVIGTAILWTYQDGWVQLTFPPREILFIGTELPELGSENMLYINKEEKSISVWNSATQSYDVVSDRTESITEEEILNLFN